MIMQNCIYLTYLYYIYLFFHPDPSVNKRSGLLMPTVETDNKLGDTLSIPIFYNKKVTKI